MSTNDRPKIPSVHDRLAIVGARVLSDAELLTAVLAPTSGANPVSKAASALLEAAPIAELAWASPEQLATVPGIGRARAAALVAAFELGRRAGWAPPQRGERVLDPAKVFQLLRHVAHAEREEFHIVLLDARGRLMKTVKIAEGGLTQCPVAPRDALREAVRIGAHGCVWVHNHPSSFDPTPSDDDRQLTERLRAAAELVGVLARDHVVIAGSSYFSFVEAGLWRR
jgi:DNA repair protein RadC